MKEIRTAGCKVNLSLRITGVREDGYHTLDSLFWPIDHPCDTLEFLPTELTDGAHLSVSCDTEGIDIHNNTLTKAHAAFLRAGGAVKGVHVHLHKNIPHGAGLGGGSSDAAIVLKWCNDHAERPLSEAELHAVALQVGADVPFFLRNAPSRVQGIGDILEECAPVWRNYAYVLICPNIAISTPWAYKMWDERKNNFFSKKCLTKTPSAYRNRFSCGAQENTTQHSKTELSGCRVSQEERLCLNDFEPLVFEKYPLLNTLKENLLELGAEIAVMSGTGSTMVGVFKEAHKARIAAETFEHREHRVFLGTL